jgi:hypothetical protein
MWIVQKKGRMKILGIIISLLVLLAFVACGTPTAPTSGLKFDGIDDQVNAGTFGNYGSMYAGKGTIEFWGKIERDTTCDYFGVVTSSEENETNEWGIWTQKLPGTQYYGPSFWITDDDGAALIGYAGGVAIDDGKWHHVAVTWDCATNTIKIYVDGISRTVTYQAQDTPSNFRNFTQDVIIGGDIWGENLTGILSDVRVWTSIRTEQEIRDNIDRVLVGNEAGLFAYWKLDEGSGTIAHDSSPNGNDGTLVGNPVWFTGGG